jgi:MFS family permease
VRSLVNLLATSLVMSFGHGMIIPIIPVLVGAFDVSIGLAAQVVTAHAVGRSAGPLPGGMIVDRLGARAAMIIGPVLVATGALIAALAPSFELILFAMFVAGAGDSVWNIAREIAGLNLVRLDQRGRLMSGFMGTSSTGMMLGPLLGGVITVLVDFHAVFFVYAALSMAVLVFSLSARLGGLSPSVVVPSSISGDDGGWRGFSLRGHLRGWARLLGEIAPKYRATYGVLVFSTGAMMLYRMVLQSMLPLYAGIYLGFSPVKVGQLFLVSGVFVFIWILPAGFITDKIGRKWATVPSTAIPGLAFLALPFADSFLELAIISGVLGMANGLSLGSMATSTYDVIPESGRGRLQALRRTIAEVGGVGGPIAAGIIANAYNPGAPFLAAAPILILAGLLLAFVAKETLVKQRAVAT